ncbi:MAG: hypothetical protein ACI8ZN_002629 [Bacteroidia bacterium]|jgi:hypothetical protein
MKLIKNVVIVSICLILISCNNDDQDSKIVEAHGALEQQGITTYQYGTHTISKYALRSAAINLDKYVTVFGTKVEGYPLDGDPDFLEVTKVEE